MLSTTIAGFLPIFLIFAVTGTLADPILLKRSLSTAQKEAIATLFVSNSANFDNELRQYMQTLPSNDQNDASNFGRLLSAINRAGSTSRYSSKAQSVIRQVQSITRGNGSVHEKASQIVRVLDSTNQNTLNEILYPSSSSTKSRNRTNVGLLALAGRLGGSQSITRRPPIMQTKPPTAAKPTSSPSRISSIKSSVKSFFKG